MSQFIERLIGLVSPIAAQREQINLLTLEKSQLISLIDEMKNEITRLKAEVETLETKDKANSEEIEKLKNTLSQLNSFETNAVNPQGVPYRSAAPRHCAE